MSVIDLLGVTVDYGGEGNSALQGRRPCVPPLVGISVYRS